MVVRIVPDKQWVDVKTTSCYPHTELQRRLRLSLGPQFVVQQVAEVPTSQLTPFHPPTPGG